MLMTHPYREDLAADPRTQALAVRDLRKSFGSQIAVNHLNLDVPRGSIYGIVGPNGAGKTTMLTMACGLQRPDSGQSFIAGHNVWEEPIPAKQAMGLLMDGAPVFDRLTGAEYLHYLGALHKLERTESLRRAQELLDALSADLTSTPLRGKSVLDVGGGPGYFAKAFADTFYVGVEPSVSELSAAGISGYGSVRGDGTALPFATDSFDVVYSSNVAEHIPDWQKMAEEMLRVAKPGGLVVLSYTVWLGPFGGHETGLWQHYVGGEFARRRYVAAHGHEPKNKWGESLFAVSAKEGLAWAESTGRLLAAFPRYHPRWAWWLTRVPLLREFAVSNLVVVLRG